MNDSPEPSAHTENRTPASTDNDRSSSSPSRSVPTVVSFHRPGRWLMWTAWGVAIVGWGAAITLGVLNWWLRADQEAYYDTTGGMYEVFHSGSPSGDDKIAVLRLSGVIVDGSSFKAQLDRVRKDPTVKALVIRVETPGGTVYGSDFIYHHLRKLVEERSLPMVVSMGSMATSGGYYVSMAVGEQSDVVLAEPTTVTGSIGVILPHYDVSGLLKRFDVEDDSIRSHPRKQMLSMTREMSDEHRQLLQANVDASFERFKRIVLKGRPKLRPDGWSEEADEYDGPLPLAFDGRDLATGEIFSAQQALQYGLIDRIGFVEDAIDRAAELAGLDLSRTKVIRYRRPQPWLELPTIIKADGSGVNLEPFLRGELPLPLYQTAALPPLLSLDSKEGP